MPIEGKVAAILNERELVINRGESSGVTKDMLFGVIRKTEGIKDPDTKEVIGSVESVTIRLKVVDVQPKLSVCRTYETYQMNIGGSGTSLFTFLEPAPKWVTKVKTLRASQSELKELDETGSLVRVGDVVRQLTEKE